MLTDPHHLTRTRAALALLFIAALFAGAVFVGGCAKPTPAGANPQVGQDLAEVAGRIDMAKVNVTSAKPHVDPIGAVLLDSALSNLDTGATVLSRGRIGQSADAAECAKLQGKVDQRDATIRAKDERWENSFFGGKAHRWFHWIVGVTVGVFAFGVLGWWFGGTGVIGIAGRLILNIIPWVALKIRRPAPIPTLTPQI